MDIFPMHPRGRGWLEVITGTMFGGKSTELLRRLERAALANQSVVAFSRDTRYQAGAITTHQDRALQGHYAQSAEDVHGILLAHPDCDVVGIDEVQFFDKDLVDVCRHWALRGKRVIAAGLDQDYRGVPFDTTLALMAEAEYVEKRLAVCCRCGAPAVRNHIKIAAVSRIMEGAGDLYEALCRHCFAATCGEEEGC